MNTRKYCQPESIWKFNARECFAAGGICQTRDGRPAQIISIKNIQAKFPVRAKTTSPAGNLVIWEYGLTGGFYPYCEHYLDLMAV